jgi:hypothetical protein
LPAASDVRKTRAARREDCCTLSKTGDVLWVPRDLLRSTSRYSAFITVALQLVDLVAEPMPEACCHVLNGLD